MTKFTLTLLFAFLCLSGTAFAQSYDWANAYKKYYVQYSCPPTLKSVNTAISRLINNIRNGSNTAQDLQDLEQLNYSLEYGCDTTQIELINNNGLTHDSRQQKSECNTLLKAISSFFQDFGNRQNNPSLKGIGPNFGRGLGKSCQVAVVQNGAPFPEVWEDQSESSQEVADLGEGAASHGETEWSWGEGSLSNGEGHAWAGESWSWGEGGLNGESEWGWSQENLMLNGMEHDDKEFMDLLLNMNSIALGNGNANNAGNGAGANAYWSGNWQQYVPGQYWNGNWQQYVPGGANGNQYYNGNWQSYAGNYAQGWGQPNGRNGQGLRAIAN